MGRLECWLLKAGSLGYLTLSLLTQVYKQQPSQGLSSSHPWERGRINRYQKTIRECVVPENIHTPPTEVFFSFCTPLPREIPV